MNKEVHIVRCDLCGMEFHSDDSLIENRMQRHQERHNPIGIPASSNIIRGKVNWLLVFSDKIKRGTQ